jgi:sugar fermentation stimulation protein A
MDLAGSGARVALFFLVQRPDGHCFGPADFIDPDYATLFYEALDAGVEAWPYVADVDRTGISLGRRLQVVRP